MRGGGEEGPEGRLVMVVADKLRMDGGMNIYC